MAAQRIFTRDFIIAMTILMCSSMNFFLILINLQDFVEDDLGGSASQAGVAAGLYVIGGLVSRLLLGKYVELVGRKRMLIIALSLANVVILAFNCACDSEKLCPSSFRSSPSSINPTINAFLSSSFPTLK